MTSAIETAPPISRAEGGNASIEAQQARTLLDESFALFKLLYANLQRGDVDLRTRHRILRCCDKAFQRFLRRRQRLLALRGE